MQTLGNWMMAALLAVLMGGAYHLDTPTTTASAAVQDAQRDARRLHKLHQARAKACGGSYRERTDGGFSCRPHTPALLLADATR